MTEPKKLALDGSIAILQSALKGAVSKKRACELAIELLDKKDMADLSQWLLERLQDIKTTGRWKKQATSKEVVMEIDEHGKTVVKEGGKIIGAQG